MSRPVRLLVLLLSISVVLAMALFGFQRRLLYFPGGAPPPVGQVLPGAEAVGLRTADDRTLTAWWLPGGPTAVVVLPGNAGNRAGRAPLARALGERGLSVLLVDYRGYGGNPGAPTEEGLLADGRAALAGVRAREQVRDVVLFGESLGAAVAIGITGGDPTGQVDALVLRSPFTSVVDVARTHYGPVPSFLVLDRWRSIERVEHVEVPMLVLATRDDEVVPYAQSRRLAQVAGAQLVAVQARGHNDPALVAGDELVTAVADFLRTQQLLPDA